MKRQTPLLVLLIGFGLGFACDGLISHAPEEALTSSHIAVLERAIKDYCLRYGKLPESLDELSLVGREHCRQNPWGVKICYVVTNGNEVVLRTFGRGGSTAEVVQMFERRFRCALPRKVE